MIFVICSTEENSSCWRKSNLRAVVHDQFSFIISTIKFNLFENSFITATHNSHCIDSIVIVDADRTIDKSFCSRLLGAVKIEKFGSTIFHSHSISHDDSISSTGD